MELFFVIKTTSASVSANSGSENILKSDRINFLSSFYEKLNYLSSDLSSCCWDCQFNIFSSNFLKTFLNLLNRNISIGHLKEKYSLYIWCNKNIIKLDGR